MKTIPASLQVPMPQHCVSIRHRFRDWPVEDLDAIESARRLYDRGKAEVCTGRAGEYFILYCIPRVRPAPPRRWFTYSGVY